MKRLSLAAVAVVFAAACGSDNPPRIQSFTAASSSIALGDSTELVFAADPAATLAIDQGVGPVTGKTWVSVSPSTTTTYTLTATALGMSTTSKTTVSVGHGPATQITLAGLSSELAVDTPASIAVTVRDRFGNAVTDYTGTLHFVSTDAAVPPIADVSFTAAMQGTTTVNVLFFTQGEQSLIATDTARPALTSSTITQVLAGNTTTYALSALPASAVAGEPLPLTITAVDSHGNVAKNYAGTAHVSSTDPTDRLPADGGFTRGVRNVSLAFVTAASHFATVSEVGGTIRVNTTSVTVVSGDAVALLVSGASTVAGAGASTMVTAKDTYGNTVASYTGTVAFSSSDGQAVLPGGYTFVTADAGQHSFPLTLKSAGAQTVTATDAGHSISGSGGFTVAPAAGTNCSVTDLAPSAAAGAQLGLRVTVRDDFANVATGYAGTVALSSSDTGAQLSAPGTYTATDAGSRAFSAQLRKAGAQTVTATDAANAISCQGSINIVPGATLFTVTFAGTDAWAGTGVNAIVTAQDGFANVITNYAGTIAFTSSDSAAAKPANVTLNGTEGGTTTVAVTFNTIGLQTLTATDTALATATGTGTQTVHGLLYTDPASGGKVRLVKNASSTTSVVQLDLVSNTSLFTLGLADPVNPNRVLPSTTRNGAFAAGMNLPLDLTKVGADTQLLVPAPAATAILTLGAPPLAVAAVLTSGPNGVLYSGVSQKRVDATTTCTAPCTNDHLRGDVAVRPSGAASLYYSFRLKLIPGATPGTVFDGQSLNAKFHAAVRDRSGSDVFQNADFAIGKLEVR